MKLTFIGDVHGKFSAYMDIVNKCEASIQVGDFGIGFGVEPPVLPPNHYFIRGNHDAPHEAKGNPSYLGDYGCFGNKLFYSSGAFSIDKKWRTPGVDWWAGEELSEQAMYDASDIYKAFNPSIVVSHSLPHSIQQRIFSFDPEFYNRTGAYLDRLLKTNTPDIWICGHYHKAVDTTLFGCRFVVLPELGTFELDV